MALGVLRQQYRALLTRYRRDRVVPPLQTLPAHQALD